MRPILHLVSLTSWDDALAAGRYAPTSLHEEGFVHFSTADQVAATAKRYYSAVDDLALVLYDAGELDVRFEAPAHPIEGGWDERFPHVYEQLDPARAVAVGSYEPGLPWDIPADFPRPPTLDERRFALGAGGGDGEVDTETVFVYREPGDGTVRADYAGGAVEVGRLVGWRALDRLRFRYVQIDRAGGVSVGECQSTIVARPDGRLELDERWRWLSRDGSGTSTMVEL